MRTLTPTASLLATAVLLAACGAESPETTGAATDAPAVAAAPLEAETAATETFLTHLTAHCGKAYAGRIVANDPAPENDPFADQPLVMHVRECGEREVRIPFHVGDDHSRTWVLARTENGLRLKHDHRHRDGAPDKVTMYGGDATTPPGDRRQIFPADDESKAMFEHEGMSVSTANVWAMEIAPDEHFAYELARPGRLFRVEFDLTAPVTPPPAPWGSE